MSLNSGLISAEIFIGTTGKGRLLAGDHRKPILRKQFSCTVKASCLKASQKTSLLGKEPQIKAPCNRTMWTPATKPSCSLAEACGADEVEPLETQNVRTSWLERLKLRGPGNSDEVQDVVGDWGASGDNHLNLGLEIKRLVWVFR